MRYFSCVALLDFTNVIGPNGSTYDRETSHFTGCDPQKNLFTVSQWVYRCFLSLTVHSWCDATWHDVVNGQFLSRQPTFLKKNHCRPANFGGQVIQYVTVSVIFTVLKKKKTSTSDQDRAKGCTAILADLWSSTLISHLVLQAIWFLSVRYTVEQLQQRSHCQKLTIQQSSVWPTCFLVLIMWESANECDCFFIFMLWTFGW